jgi:hypothetical protein
MVSDEACCFDPVGEAQREAIERKDRVNAVVSWIVTHVLQWACAVRGHDSMMYFERDRLSLKCVSCGHESTGWELTEAPPRLLFAGDPHRHQLVRPRFVDVHRAA